MKKSCLWAIFLALVCYGGLFAGEADLVLTYEQSAIVAIDWEGTGDLEGDGTLIFSDFGDTQTATLSILCNKLEGYKVTLYSANATSATGSVLVNGSDTISYTTAMDTSGVQNANITLSSLVLNNGAQPSLDVNFASTGDLPLNGSTSANQLLLTFVTDAFDGNLRPQGVYTDTITATIALN